ncbi:hypothetical protein J6V86_00090 [bacterium]|nr:hypothetical protein [bacterium]
MKKSLLVSLILLSGILLTGCFNKSEENVSGNETSNLGSSSEVENNVLSSNTTEMDCTKVIENYLASADKD